MSLCIVYWIYAQHLNPEQVSLVNPSTTLHPDDLMKKAFIVYGGFPGHEPKESTDFWSGILEGDGVEVTRSESMDDLIDADALQQYDLIIPNWTMGTMSNEQVKGLETAVAAGTGLGGWHGGMGDAFRENAHYNFMTGGQFVSHPGGIKEYTVNITNREHAITTGLDDFQMVSEQYYLHVDPANEVLATTTFDGAGAPWTEGVVMPVVWTKSWGKGRVFYCSLGHKVVDFEVPECQEIIRRGLLWAKR